MAGRAARTARTAGNVDRNDRAGDGEALALIDTFLIHFAPRSLSSLFSLSLPFPFPPLFLSPTSPRTAQPQSNMPFERYLHQPQEPTPSSSSSHPINDYAYVQSQYPSSSGPALYPSAITPSLHFQMPQFMLDGPPTLAHGGGAEVLPAGFGSSESLASAWIANTGFVPDCSEDVYVRLQQPPRPFSLSLASSLTAQSIIIPPRPPIAITLRRAHLPSPQPPPPSRMLFSHIYVFLLSFRPLPNPRLFRHWSLRVAPRLAFGHPLFPHRRLLASPYIHPQASTSSLS